ncbi:MAG: hypothetical protein PUH93_05225 [Clostridia bacterium]|nr:hypothetical protein [Clostridia bacterium]
MEKIKIGESFKTAFSNDAGVFQDGTVPLYRDVDGKLWGMMHSDDEGRSWKFDRWVLTFLRLFCERRLFDIANASAKAL